MSNNNNHNNNNLSTTTTRVGGSNGTTQACAACKYQRRKCAPDCILAPYFPHDRQRQFLNAHKLFGVSNITKIIRNLDPPEKEEAMRTIIFQSDVRANDPVGGCYRIIRDLQRQIEFTKAELDIVLHQLAICRAHEQQSHQHQDVNLDPFNSYYQMNDQDHHQNTWAMQNSHHNLQDHLQNPWVMQDSIKNHHDHQQRQQQQPPFVSECDDIKPSTLLEIPYQRNDPLKFEDEDQTVQQSDEGVLNEEKAIFKEENASIQHAQDQDLKEKVTLFTLTNCNS